MRVVGIALVHDEDVFVERAIRNVAGFCDRIHAVDHLSTDDTWEKLQLLACDLDHLDIRRARHARVSHQVLEPYMGTETWALRVDGDELYEPERLGWMRQALEAGEFRSAFRVQANVLHCVSLDTSRWLAKGYLSPPSRPITTLFNLSAVYSWTGSVERLEGGTAAFRPGFGRDTVEAVHDSNSWDDSPLRCLHVCFLRRSSLEPLDSPPRRTLTETGFHRRGALGAAIRLVRRPRLDPLILDIHERGSSWKSEKYRRGALVEKDVGSFFPEPAQVSA